MDYPIIIVSNQTDAVDNLEETDGINILDDTSNTTHYAENITLAIADDTNDASTVTISSTSIPSVLDRCSSRHLIEKFDLEEFLKKDFLGEALLAKGLRTSLSAVDRDRLTDIIIRNLLNQYGRLGFAELEILSKKIEKVFPREFHYTYFVPAITKGRSNQNVSEKAKGKLVDKQRNLLYLLKTLQKDGKDKNVNQSSDGHASLNEG